MSLRIYPEFRNVEAFIASSSSGNSPGLVGTNEVRGFARNMPPNINFYLKQSISRSGSTSTLLYAGCHGTRSTCRQRLRGLGVPGFFRS